MPQLLFILLLGFITFNHPTLSFHSPYSSSIRQHSYFKCPNNHNDNKNNNNYDNHYGTITTKSRVVTVPSYSNTLPLSSPSSSSSSLFAFKSNVKIPSSTSERDNQAIQAIKAAIDDKTPKDPSSSSSLPLIECEFPVLKDLNKLGDGSLRSTIEAETANLAFVSKLMQALTPPPIPLLFPSSPKISILVSSSASKSFLAKTKSTLLQNKDKGGRINIYSLREEEVLLQRLATTTTNTNTNNNNNNNNNNNSKQKEICIMITPSSRKDFQISQQLASSGDVTAVVVLNAFAKDPKSIPSTATMAYYLKPLTYNSQIAGYLLRSYPSPWTVLDAFSREVLGTFNDKDILVRGTNTPDLRSSGRLVQKSVDDRAIRARNLR